MDHYIELIPAELRHRSGAVFNAGRHAFGNPSDLYMLGLNPGGAPEDHVRETVDFHTNKVLSRADNWCEHRDESWDGRAPGTAGMQPRILHLLSSLSLDPGQVPSSNVVFLRTRDEARIQPEFARLAQLCWPLHAAVIARQRVKTVLCFGKTAGRFVRDMTGAHHPIGSLAEDNDRGWACDAFANADGLTIVVATHPSRVAWNNAASDPTPLIRHCLQWRPGDEALANAPKVPVARASGTPPRPEPVFERVSVRTGSSADRSEELLGILKASGLGQVLTTAGRRYFPNKKFSKLKFQRNDHKISSIELWDRERSDGFFRIHYLPGVSSALVESMKHWPSYRNANSSGSNFQGQPVEIAQLLARALG